MEVEATRVGGNALPRHAEEARDIAASAASLFDYIDRPERLSAHMGWRSLHLLGSMMTVDTDADRGQRVGSRLSLRGRVLGIPLNVNAVIVAREPPTRKVWETIGDPHLLVIGPYRMRVMIADCGRKSHVTVGIDYALPPRWPDRWLGRLLGAAYARWCVRQMVGDVQRTFADLR